MSRVDVAIYAPIVGLMGNGDFFFAKKLADYFSKNNQFNAYIITNNKKLCNGDNILVEKEYDKKIKNSAISPYLLFLGPTLSMCKSPDKIFKSNPEEGKKVLQYIDENREIKIKENIRLK